MKRASLLLLIIFGLHQVASADIIFSLSPNNQVFNVGDTIQFQLRIASSLLAGEQVDAAEFNAVAGPGNGQGGVFVDPTATVILNPATSPIDITHPLGQAFGSNFQTGGILVPNAGIVFANLFLNTTGVVPAVYQLSLTDLAANSPSTAGLLVSGTPIAYELVAAVPEPTSMLTVALFGCGSVISRRRRSC